MIRSKAVSRTFWLLLLFALQTWPGMVAPAYGQGSRKDDIVFNSRGVPLAGASVHVCNMPATGLPCSPTAQIYSDPLLTQALANPTTTDGMGNYFFYAAPGQYEIEISGPNITTKQIPNVILPSDPANPTFSSLSSTGGISAFTLSLSGNLTVNGSTSVVGNLASGTLTLSNQASPPGAASAGTVNLYTKALDKRLYYKDETGTEIGPLATASGAQTNVANSWTAPQYFDADFHTKGPNPTWDVTQFGGYIGPNYATPTTGSISSGSSTLTVASAMDFAAGQGILVVGAGPAPVIATPQAPTVTPIAQTGSTSLSYCVADQDWFGGFTPCSAAGTTTSGVSSFGLKSYTISGWSSSGSVVTITTSAAHNIPTSKYQTFLWPQVEIQQGSTNSAYCEGAFTVVAVPSSTTIQITRYGVPDATMNGCSGGTLRVLPRVILNWDSHYTFSVTNAACSGSTATLTISPSIYGAAGTWVVPYNIKGVIAGVSDSHYNTTANISGWSTSSNVVSYPVVGGSCSGVNTGSLGGTVSLVPGKAVKNHLIYRCSGSSCALPANAANYSLVGVAVGNDGYFVDNGNSPSAAGVDLGTASATAPTGASKDYLSTTISSLSGTTFTLAANASSTVSGANVFHDNTPNVLATCSAMPTSGLGANGGHIIIPAPLSTSAQGGSLFPIMANLDTAPAVGYCHGNTTLDFRAGVWLQGTILAGKGINFVSDQGGANCSPAFYPVGTSMECVAGLAYPMLYFEPEQSSNNYFANLMFAPNQPYQPAFFYDQQLNGDGVTIERYENVHVNGTAGAMPIVDKGGFGRFWNYGGWSAAAGNFATQRTYLFTQNCGMPTYVQQSGSAMGPSIIRTDHTYNFGTAQVDGCGQSGAHWQNATFNDMLSENMYGPVFQVNTAPYDISSVTFHISSYSDPDGGYSTPYYDLTNSFAQGLRFEDNGCATAFQPLLETSTTGSLGIRLSSTNSSNCSFVGAQSYVSENLGANVYVDSAFNQELLNNSQVYSPMAMPGNFQSVTQQGAGNVAVGTYTYCLTASDALGGETGSNSSSCTQITVTGQASIVQMIMPASFPAGATGLNLYINGSLANANGCVKPQYTTPGGAYNYNFNYNCGGSPPGVTTAVAAAINPTAVAAPKLLLNGEFTGSVARSEQNIFLPGALTSTWTASSWTPDKAVTVTRVQVQAKTAPAGCSTNAIVQVTNGTTPINLTISAAANDSGSISQNYAAGTPITVSVQTAAAGCSTSPADANVAVQYRMQ
ncbi:MAG: hypothetical protein WBR26_03240 [Candidatus Acidiferrum sp.]